MIDFDNPSANSTTWWVLRVCRTTAHAQKTSKWKKGSFVGTGSFYYEPTTQIEEAVRFSTADKARRIHQLLMTDTRGVGFEMVQLKLMVESRIGEL